MLFYLETNSKSGKTYLIATMKYTWFAYLSPPLTGINHYSLQKKPNKTLLPCLFIKAKVALLPKPKIRLPKNFRKVETATGRAEKCDTIFESHYRNTQICQNKHSWSDFISGAYCAVININPNRAFWFAFALLLLQIIDMQHLQMFPFSSCIRDVRRIRVAPYTWTISRPAELWFGIHYLSPLLFLRPFVVLFFFSFCAKPSADLKLPYHTCWTIGLIKKNSA